jgi:hypothetical protein
MKKYTLIAVVFALSIFNVVSAFAQLEGEGNMGCRSLSGCTGQATCESPGTVTDCYIACDNGAQIFCPTKSENE